jgi:hypothetical protein
MVTSASCCRAMGGISCFVSASRESWVWNDWYSVGAVVGHMGSTSVGICSCFRYLLTTLKGSSWVLRCCWSGVLVAHVVCASALIFIRETAIQ